jgi:hypothetical protein
MTQAHIRNNLIADVIALCLMSSTRSSLYGAGKRLPESWVDHFIRLQ